MKFIEMSGKTLVKVVSNAELEALRKAGVTDHSLVRINQQGDVEIRQKTKWDVVGGLLGDFDTRVRNATGLEWA